MFQEKLKAEAIGDVGMLPVSCRLLRLLHVVIASTSRHTADAYFASLIAAVHVF